MPADPPPLPGPARPPPLPTRPSKLPPMRRPMPSDDGFMSTQEKISLADFALALRDEQLEAKVVHYKEELQTSPELDAITAQVIKELKDLQRAAKGGGQSGSTPPTGDRAQVEIELIASLKEMLGRIFRPGKLATVFERKLGEVSKRFARVFFESELHDKLRGSTTEVKTMRFPEQALYHVLSRNQEYLGRQLEGFEYDSPKTLERASEAFADFVKELRNDFLARTTPELNTLVRILNQVLTEYFTVEFPPNVAELAWEVVREARLADARSQAGYKIPTAMFPRFRQAFERRFLQRLVAFAEDEMLRRVRESKSTFRVETIRFVADPYIFSDVCEIICESIYDLLYNDGFLDLPADWRARLSAAPR